MKLRTKIVSAIAGASLIAAGIVGLSTSSASAAATPGPRSGLPWTSGAYLEHSGAKIGPYEAGRGRKLDAIVVFPARESQSAMLNTWWLSSVTSVTNSGGYAVITVPLWAQNQNVNTDTTALFTQLGQQIKNSGLANKTVLRLGWEMNLPGQYWNVNSNNYAKWVSNYKRAVNLLRVNAPGIKIAFNPNEGPSQTTTKNIGQLALDLKDYYEYVGPDYYNWYNAVENQTQWNSRYIASYGMKYWEDFARNNGKGFTVPEWGGAPVYNNSTAVFYTQKMVERFAALSKEGISVLEAHFNEPASHWKDSLWNPQQMPQMAEALKAALAAQPNSPTSVPTTTSPTPTATTPSPNLTTLNPCGPTS